ncbi:MAG: sensor histidine kinase [Phycisphaerae bacterium]
MLRGFRHTLFLLLQVGVVVSAGVALLLWPAAWRAVAVCLVGALLASLICERIARRYLRKTLGRLRRVADDLGRGRQPTAIEAHPGDDFYKLVSAINLVATRLAEASQEEQRLQDELRRRERLAFLGELAATVAHEVNNPLDGIQNCSRILRRSLRDPERAPQMLDLIDDGLGRIDLIVRRLLTLAREHVIRPVEARIRDIVEAALAASGTKFEDRGIRVRRQYAGDDDHASVDPQLLEQVFVNVMLNAVDSMPQGGELTIVIRSEQRGLKSEKHSGHGSDAICVEIADSGSGIAPEVLPHIFEPFYTTKAGGRGTGLGLAIAARIVDAHDGTVDVAVRPGGGTVFSIRIPALQSAGAQHQAQQTAAPSSPAASGR